MGNSSLYTRSLPNLNKVIYEAAKLVENPRSDEIEAGRKTLYDTWQFKNPKDKNDPKSLPREVYKAREFDDHIQRVKICIST